MSGRVFVDTKVLVYAHDASTGMKHAYRIPFWDALVIQSSRAGGAETLYSEDLGDGQIYDSVRVVSPFGPDPA